MKLHRIVGTAAFLATIFALLILIVGVNNLAVVGQFEAQDLQFIRATGLSQVASSFVIELMCCLAVLSSSRYADLLDRNNRRNR
jgi:hypothetical protein